MIDLSCRDWEARLLAGRVPFRTDLPLIDSPAVAALDKLRLADVPGTPTFAEAGGQWFREIVRVMFGAWTPDGARYLRELFLLVPKKNSKTTNGALMLLVALILNRRPRSPMAMFAPVQGTADEAFEAAAGAIDLDGVLAKKFHVRNHLKTIIHRETKADLQIMTWDPDVVTGRKLSHALIDEVHVIGKSADSAKALRQIRGGMVPFPEGWLAMITTMPDGPPVGVMKAELDKARAIRDGKRLGDMLPVLYELPKAIQEDKAQPWRAPALWRLVNPNLGKSVSIEALERLYADAEAKGEGELRGWASQHVNLQIGGSLLADRWAGADYWEDQAGTIGGLADLLARCEVVDIGIDGGGLDDLLGFNVTGRERGTGIWLTWGRAWAHPSVLKRHKQDLEQLRDFERDGDLVIVDRVGEDVAQVVDLVKQCEAAGALDKVGLDPAGVGAILDGLAAAGIDGERVVGISQGWKMTGAVKTAERKLAGGELVHAGQPLLAWCVGNARIEPAGNAVKITKQASGSAKIDPLLAMVNAITLLSLNPAPPKSKAPALY